MINSIINYNSTKTSIPFNQKRGEKLPIDEYIPSSETSSLNMPKIGKIPSVITDIGKIYEFSSKFEIINDTKGKIMHLVFQYNGSYTSWGKEQLNTYNKLIDNMEDDVKFTFITTGENSPNEINEIIKNKNNPDRFKIVPIHENMSIWARDSIISGKNSNNEIELMLPARNWKFSQGDYNAAKALKEQYPYLKFTESKFLFIDGGDIIHGPTGTFIGNNSFDKITDNLKKALNETENPNNDINNAIMDLLDEKFPGGLYIIGIDDPKTEEIEKQPTFHIDMCLTPIDNKTILLADPKLALGILKDLKRENPEEYKKQIEEFRISAHIDLDADYIEKWLDDNNFYGDSNYNNFENIKNYLEEKGLKVIRVPYLNNKSNIPTISYNNCLINDYYSENLQKNIKQVFLPVYGLKALDEKAVSTYQNQGYDIVTLDFNNTGKLQGALRCTSQVIEKAN